MPTRPQENEELVSDFNAYYANFWMQLAVFHFKLPHAKLWAGLVCLVAWMYGTFALCLLLYATIIYTIWTFAAPDGSHHADSSSRLNVLLGRSWRVSQPDSTLRSNNNVSITVFKGKYFAAYRNADWHWPSKHASLLVATASHPAGPWKLVWKHKTGEDLREMLLFELHGTLFLYYCSIDSGFLGTFNVKGTRCFLSQDGVTWSSPEGRGNGLVSRPGELIWDVKVVPQDDGEPVVYKTSYMGGHYQAGGANMEVLFEQSRNGLDWTPCGSSKDGVVYRGGISEVAFEFTQRGDLVAIGRNEDGDSSGFGSQLFFASSGDLGQWQALAQSLPWRFDSPRFCRVDATGDVLLLARYTYQKYAAAPSWLPLKVQEAVNIVLYSVRPKTAAVFRLAPAESWAGTSGPWHTCKPIELVRFFEHGLAVADTGFFSVVPRPHTKDSWYVANYSAAGHSHAWWVAGQLASSHVYVAELRVEEEEVPGY
ncbi:unnamed protein product [Prorocentrum cordatum]|uniref:Uncharacterized protein n=1 Tax=Prorocentrum cordatum TaxID=2364126 RepID=A0ABN9XHC8_9DINO|nr:unnamed protein product [Polarella glacialis]